MRSGGCAIRVTSKEEDWGKILSMNIDDRIKEIRDRLKELGPIIDKQWAAQPRSAPMSDEMSEAEKLKLELAQLEHPYLKHPTNK